MNPRFWNYARATQKTVDEVCGAHRGGIMVDFGSWLGARWDEWRSARGYTSRTDAPCRPEHHVDFDVWLTAWVSARIGG